MSTSARGLIGISFLIWFSLPAFALESPNPIGYWCSPDTAPIVAGQYYAPISDPCAYYSPSLSGFRVGDVYWGDVGSSTLVIGHALSTGTLSFQNGDAREMRDIKHIPQGADLFVGIFIERSNPLFFDSQRFRDFFTKGTTPPNTNYGFLYFKYGLQPPTLTFAAASSTITEGATTTLSWSATRATTCIATEGWSGSHSISGSEIISPATTTTYVLDCSGVGGSVRATTTVSVDPRHIDPVIIIPGILGSEQHNGEWMIDPILHTYDDLIATLDLNYFTPGVDLFTFPYNWRKSNIETALLLKQKIDEVKAICKCAKVDLVAHSMGGLVARQYIQSDAYDNDVDQLIFLGTPHLGAPKAYLMWEGGEIGAGLRDRSLELILEHEAYENGYPTLFSYLRSRPIESVKELLPIYNYIFDINNTRHYPENYPINSFLEYLKLNVNRLMNSGISIYNFIGSTEEQQTIIGIQSEDGIKYSPMWEHGYPQGFYENSGVPGLIRGQGDLTVPIPSASFISQNLVITANEHSALPSEVESEIFHILTKKEAHTLVHDFHIPDAKIILFKIFSPADLLIIAPDGKKIGKDLNGQEVNEIPKAFYTGFSTNTEFMTIFNPLDGIYKIITQGTNTGSYTVEANYISDSTTTQESFAGHTTVGLTTELNLPFINSDPGNATILPTDITPPTIFINQPSSKDYLRSDILTLNITATDSESGVYSLVSAFDASTTPNNESIDLFYEKLGTHVINSTSTDNVNNATSTMRVLRVVATASSTISDINRAFALGWITKSVRDSFVNKINACNVQRKTLITTTKTIVVTGKNGKPTTKTVYEKSEKVDIVFDKNCAKNILKELDRYRGKGVNDQSYFLFKEDIQWLINNIL